MDIMVVVLPINREGAPGKRLTFEQRFGRVLIRCWAQPIPYAERFHPISPVVSPKPSGADLRELQLGQAILAF